MIIFKELKSENDFESLKVGDWVACEFFRDVSDYPKKYRFKVFHIVEIKKDDKEVILQKKNNIYFNYRMFLDGRKGNLKSAVLIEHINDPDLNYEL